MKAVLALIFVATYAVAVPVDPIAEFTTGNVQFSGQLYQQLLQSSTEDNFIVSPFSLEVVLALAQAGANGKTSEEIISALSLPSTTAQISTAMKNLLPTVYANRNHLQILTANKMFVEKTFPIKDSYVKVAQDTYQAGVETLDFSDSETAANLINAWVAEQTQDKIKDLVNANVLKDTDLILVNALYLMGQWKTPFGVDYATTAGKFYTTATKQVDVDMMSTYGAFRYAASAESSAKFLELPLVDGASMIIVLPNEITGLQSIEQNPAALFSTQEYSTKNVQLTLPKWHVETSVTAKSLLQNLGLKTIFTSEADLTGISDSPLFVSDVLQKAFINVTENGVEAGAASAIVIPGASAPCRNCELIEFKVDHPFIYYIKYQDVILFVGKTTVPAQ